MTRLHTQTEETSTFQNDDQFYFERNPASTQIDRRAGWRTIAMHFGRSAITVAATDAYAKTKQGADLVCDGTADQTEINSAIAALTKGGTVRLSEGIFNITAPVDFVNQDAVALVGAGAGERSTAAGVLGTNAVGTRIFANASFTGTALILVKRADTTRPVANCAIMNLTVDGNKANVAGTVHGIFFSSHNGLIQRVYAANCDGDGIVVQGVDTGHGDAASWDTYDTMLAQIITMGHGGAGIRYSYGSPDSHLVQAVCHTSQDGIVIQSAHHQIMSVQCYNNTRYGVYFNDHGSWTKMTNMKIEVNDQHGMVIDADTVDLPDIQVVNSNFRLNSNSSSGTYNDILIQSTGNDHYVYRPYFEAIQFTPGSPKPGYNLSINRCQNGIFTFSYETTSYVTGVVQDNGLSSLINGWGTNAGVPSSAGNWNTRAREGAMVRDTSGGGLYVYQGGSWRQLA